MVCYKKLFEHSGSNRQVHALPSIRPNALVEELYQLVATCFVQSIELRTIRTLVVNKESFGCEETRLQELLANDAGL